MILQCTECKARYVVPDSAIGPDGRTVRCANCGHNWFQQGATADFDALLSEINAVPKPIPIGSNLPAIQRPRRTHWSLKVFTGMLSSTAAILALLVFYPLAIGLKPSRGLELAGTHVEKTTVDRHTTYQISGKVTNTSDGAMKIPTLRVTLVDDSGQQLQFWDFRGRGKILAPGADIPFATGDLEVNYSTADRFVVELGNSLELLLRRKPK